MKITFEDTEIIRKFESFSLKAYPDPITKKEPYTIGWGLTGPWVKKGLTITESEARKKYEEHVNTISKVISNLIKVPVNKNQFIALLSLTFNIGLGAFAGSTLLKRLNMKQYHLAAEEFLAWNKVKGKPVPGLTIRRKSEQTLFLTKE